MSKRILVALLIFSITSPAFASDVEQTIANQAIVLAQGIAAQPEARPQTSSIQTPPNTPDPDRGNKKSKLLLISGAGLIAFGATMITYGAGQFGHCAGPATSTQVYSNANACYSDKVSGWMLGVGGGSVLVLGSLFTRNK